MVKVNVGKKINVNRTNLAMKGIIDVHMVSKNLDVMCEGVLKVTRTKGWWFVGPFTPFIKNNIKNNCRSIWKI